MVYCIIDNQESVMRQTKFMDINSWILLIMSVQVKCQLATNQFSIYICLHIFTSLI